MDPTAIKVRLSQHRMSIIWPGLDFIVRSNLTRIKTGESIASYPFRIHPLPYGFELGGYRQAFMDLIHGLWTRLQPQAKTGGRVELNAFELRVAILSVRISLQLRRITARDFRKSDSETKRRFGSDKESIVRFGRKTTRVIESLERSMKRASRLYASVNSQFQFTTLSREWREHI